MELSLRRRLAALMVALTLPLAGCVTNVRTDEIAGQGLEGSARWADGFRHKILGEATGTAHGAYSPLFGWVYWLFNIPVVDGGYRTATIREGLGAGIVGLWFSQDPVEAAARYDAIQSIKGADVLIAVRVKRASNNTTFGLWRDETVTVTGKAVQLLD